MAPFGPERVGPAAGVVLQFGPVLRAIVALLLAGGVAALAAVATRYRGGHARSLEIALVLLLALLGGAAVEIFGVAHRLVPGGLERVTPWQEDVVVRWADVTSISWSGPLRAYELRARGGEGVRVYEQLIAIGAFARAALDGVPAAVLDASPEVRRRLDALARGRSPPDQPEPESWRGG